MVSYQMAAGRKKPKVHPLVRWASQLFDAQQEGPDSRQMPHAKIAKVLCSRISLPNCAGKTVLVQRPQLYVGAEMTLFLFSHAPHPQDRPSSIITSRVLVGWPRSAFRLSQHSKTELHQKHVEVIPWKNSENPATWCHSEVHDPRTPPVVRIEPKA